MSYGFAIDFFLNMLQPLFPYTFDPLFAPLLGVGSPLTGARLTIAAVSVVLAGILSIVYYLLMDLEAYQELQDRREELNEKMKEAREEGDMEESKEHMSKMSDLTMDNMKIMMKPMLASMVIFFLILPWMYVTFVPIADLNPVDNGYTGDIELNGRTMPFEVVNGTEPVVIVEGEEHAVGDSFTMEDLPWKVKDIDLENRQVRFAAEIVQLPFSLPLVGDELGWLSTYILVVIPFNFLFRKLLGIQ